MIFYFSGTGNSKYIASRISKELDDKIVNVNELIKTNNMDDIDVKGDIVMVAPSYYFRMPHIVEEWFKNIIFKNVKNIYFILSYFSMYENAKGYNEKLALYKNMNYMGTMPIRMPNNHITQYVPSTIEEAKAIIGEADKQIDNAINYIKSGNKFPDYKVNLMNKFMSKAVNPLLYKMFVSPKGFKVTDKCNYCGACVSKCPLNNISIKEKMPVWGNNCTHCLSCIMYCPNEAIEYKKISKGKNRYHIEQIR